MSSFQVRNSESSWRETRKQLRKDHRWELADLLDRDEKEKLFEEHIDLLNKKNKEMFHKLLDETLQVRKQNIFDKKCRHIFEKYINLSIGMSLFFLNLFNFLTINHFLAFILKYDKFFLELYHLELNPSLRG